MIIFNVACSIFLLDSAALEAGLLILIHLIVQQIFTECLPCVERWARG